MKFSKRNLQINAVTTLLCMLLFHYCFKFGLEFIAIKIWIVVFFIDLWLLSVLDFEE